MMVHDVQNNQLQISSSRSIPPGSTLSHGQRSGAKVCISQVPGSRRSLEEALDLMRTPEIRASKQPDYFGGVFAAVCGGAFAAASDAARAADPRKTLQRNYRHHLECGGVPRCFFSKRAFIAFQMAQLVARGRRCTAVESNSPSTFKHVASDQTNPASHLSSLTATATGASRRYLFHLPPLPPCGTAVFSSCTLLSKLMEATI